MPETPDDWTDASVDPLSPVQEQDPATFDELPPVEPPSAGFIVQLFLVPLLIVGAVIGLYVLFGKLAAGQQDWRQQIIDFRSDNPHIRWRGALGLAQMLEADQQLQPDGTRLADNREVATELSRILDDLLIRSNPGEEDVKQQEFLARTLGQLNAADIILPTLGKATSVSHDREVRKNALASIATIAERATRGEQSTFDDRAIVGDVIVASNDGDSLVRHTATFALGLLPSDAARQRLESLTESEDPLCRVNAAVGLARSHSLKGLPVFEEVLMQVDPAAKISADDDSSLEQMLMVSNTIKALSELRTDLDPPARERFARLLEPIAEGHADSRIRVDAASVLGELNSR